VKQKAATRWDVTPDCEMLLYWGESAALGIVDHSRRGLINPAAAAVSIQFDARSSMR
jgi:hypothetical protein